MPKYYLLYAGHKLALAFAMCSLTLIPSYCFADGFGSNRFKFNGFATFGLVKSGTDNLGYRRDVSGEGVHDRDWSLKPDSRLGLQGSVTLTDELDAIIQFIIKDRAENGIEESLEWAYLRYRLTQQVTVRAGRLGIELFMLSNHRDLGFAYLWVRPPIEFYAPIAFDYLDGVDINYSVPLGSGTLRTAFFAGSSDAPLDYSDQDDELLLNNILGLMVRWEWEHWQAQFTLASADLDGLDESLGIKGFTANLSAASLWAEAALLSEQLNDNDEGISYYSIGISYDKNPWFIQSEVMYLDSGHNVLKSYFSRYISVGFRAGDTTLYTTIAKGTQTESRTTIPELPVPLAVVPDLVSLRQGLQTFYDYSYIDQKTASFGVRWDIRYDLALKTQWDRTWVEEAGGLLWDQKLGSSEDNVVDTYSINLNYIF